jgi:hypothetical protein
MKALKTLGFQHICRHLVEHDSVQFLLGPSVISSAMGEASMAKHPVPREQVFGCCSQVINNWQKHPKSGGFDKQSRRIERQVYFLAGAAFLAGATTLTGVAVLAGAATLAGAAFLAGAATLAGAAFLAGATTLAGAAFLAGATTLAGGAFLAGAATLAGTAFLTGAFAAAREQVRASRVSQLDSVGFTLSLLLLCL